MRAMARTELFEAAAQDPSQTPNFIASPTNFKTSTPNTTPQAETKHKHVATHCHWRDLGKKHHHIDIKARGVQRNFSRREQHFATCEAKPTTLKCSSPGDGFENHMCYTKSCGNIECNFRLNEFQLTPSRDVLLTLTS